VRFRPPSRLSSIRTLRPYQFADLFFDLVHLREAIQGVLGEDLSPVEKDFERSRLTGGERHRPQLFIVIMKQILRQTGGSGKIPSGGAVLDPHYWLLTPRPLVGPVVGHVSPPFIVLPGGWLDSTPNGSQLTRVSHGRPLRRDRLSCTLSHAACRARRVDCTSRCRDTFSGDRGARASSRMTDGHPPVAVWC
jgi:hypothetical protein